MCGKACIVMARGASIGVSLEKDAVDVDGEPQNRAWSPCPWRVAVKLRQYTVVRTRKKTEGTIHREGETPITMTSYPGVCSPECVEKLGPEWVRSEVPYRT